MTKLCFEDFKKYWALGGMKNIQEHQIEDLIQAYECLKQTHESNLNYFIEENTQHSILITELQDEVKRLKKELSLITGMSENRIGNLVNLR